MKFDKINCSIHTDRLYLRLFEKNDAETIKELCNNINIYKTTLYIPYPYTINDALVWMENHKKNFDEDRMYEFAITDKESGDLLGAIALSNNKKFNNGEIAYWIGEKYWNRGYGTEAAKALVDFAFEEKKLHKVFARYFKSNPASGKIMKKIGMKQEGLLREQVKKDGKYEDLFYFGIINPQEDIKDRILKH